MGTWGVKALENDGAMDFAGELDGETTLGKLRQAFKDLENAKAGDEYIDSQFTEPAIAAAEIVAALAKGDASNLGVSAAGYVAKIRERPSAADIARARAAVATVLDKSETKDLFEDSESADEWKAEMAALAARLGAL